MNNQLKKSPIILFLIDYNKLKNKGTYRVVFPKKSIL